MFGVLASNISPLRGYFSKKYRRIAMSLYDVTIIAVNYGLVY